MHKNVTVLQNPIFLAIKFTALIIKDATVHKTPCS
jgi:hypothetical protein